MAQIGFEIVRFNFGNSRMRDRWNISFVGLAYILRFGRVIQYTYQLVVMSA